MYLNCHSYYSFKYGTLSPKELLQLAQQQGVQRIALTDINNTSGCIDFCRIAQKEYGIHPIIGVDFRQGVTNRFIALARNMEGFAEINTYLTQLLHSKDKVDFEAPSFYNVFVVYPFEVLVAAPKRSLKPYEFIGIHASQLQQFRFSSYKNEAHKLVVLHPITFGNKRSFNMHRLLRAMDKNVLLSQLDVQEQASSLEQFTPAADIQKVFKDYPKILHRTEEILEQCFVDFDFGKNNFKNRTSYSGSPKQDFSILKKAAQKGLHYRYGMPSKLQQERLDKELAMINQLGFNAYFLLNWEIIQYARHKNYFYVGRGSGANSVVAYCLQITDVDPIDLDLYFERFINPARTSPPDFDIDFSWKDRDDVTDFIFKRFTKGHPNTVALLATYSTLQTKAVVRELGKVFGLPKVEIDQLLQGGKVNVSDEYTRWINHYSNLLGGFPSHLSIHAGGILIAEKSMFNYTALNQPPKGYPLTQFSMLEAEDIGLYKFDILSQRGLGKIKDTLDIIKYNQPNAPAFDIHDIKRFKADERIADMLEDAQTMGCFYVESPAMRMLLKKLRARTYLALVAASSIIRPGVAKSGMMREYILRFHNPEKRFESPPELLAILEETYGVMVYQEDVIKVAHYFAGLTLLEADVMRRGMSGKYRARAEFAKAKDRFFSNCKTKGYKDSLTKEIWRQIESFAGYAFSKGHSASYAVESYQCLFLKAYFPLEYMVATINNFGGFYRTEYYIHEARMSGATIEAPCVNNSYWATVIDGKAIYLGFALIKEMAHAAIHNLEEERKANGCFSSLGNFIDRVDISVEQLRLLVRINAFRFTGKSKQTLLWEIHTHLGSHKKTNPQQLLFSSNRSFELPVLECDTVEAAFDEFELLGFPLVSPFKLLVESYPKLQARELPNFKNEVVQITGYLVTIKNTGTSKGQRMCFGTFLDDAGHWIDTVHFPPSLQAYPFRGKGCYLLEGKVVEEFGFFTLEVDKMVKLRWKSS